jgi:hypothetical protein
VFTKKARQSQPVARSGRNHAWGARRSEGGAIAVMAAFIILVMIAMFGFALDLSRAYNRKMELQSVADAAALAAAGALNGTSDGIDKAALAAAAAASTFSYSYNKVSVDWSPAALSFGTAADGGSRGWVDEGSAKGSAGNVFFVRADTSKLDPSVGRVINLLMPILSSAFAETKVSGAAVAGRHSLNALPLAVCANSNTPASSLASGELVEYGFRRGVSYDLMNLNPGGRTPENFLVNPIAPAGTVGVPMMGRMEIVAAYICTGQMAIPALQGGGITVERGFPIGSLYPYLNSRFGTYVPPCQSSSAPTDPNTIHFDLANVPWMKDKPDGPSATPLLDPDPLLTVAEKPAGATDRAYGPLWSYAKAAKYASYTANNGVEPAAGYTTFASSDWATLYTPGLPAAQNYPGTTPYQNTGGAAAYKTLYNTRVLRIPLLQCPVTSGSQVAATVLGIGKFFMTVPAGSSKLYAEFAGMENSTAIRGNVRLY